MCVNDYTDALLHADDYVRVIMFAYILHICVRQSCKQYRGNSHRTFWHAYVCILVCMYAFSCACMHFDVIARTDEDILSCIVCGLQAHVCIHAYTVEAHRHVCLCVYVCMMRTYVHIHMSDMTKFRSATRMCAHNGKKIHSTFIHVYMSAWRQAKACRQLACAGMLGVPIKSSKALFEKCIKSTMPACPGAPLQRATLYTKCKSYAL